MNVPDDVLAAQFVERLRTARKTLRLPQRAAAEILGVSQRQFSDYERGAPAPKRWMVERLEQRVAERRALESLQSLSLAPPHPLAEDAPRLLSDEGFYGFVEDFITSWETKRANETESKCDFFIFGPERLPVFAVQRERNLWSANLRRQVSYHLFGLLDGLSSDQIRDVFFTLNKIDLNAEPDSPKTVKLSKIHLHGILAIPGLAEDTRVLYEDLRKATASNRSRDAKRRIVFQPLINIQDPEGIRWLRAIRLGGTSPLMVGRAVLDVSKGATDLIAPPPIFAARRLEKVSLSPDNTPETGWLFLDKYSTVDLINYIDNITSATEREEI